MDISLAVPMNTEKHCICFFIEQLISLIKEEQHKDDTLSNLMCKVMSKACREVRYAFWVADYRLTVCEMPEILAECLERFSTAHL